MHVVNGATPEELETLLEDAIVLQDAQAVSRLFEPGGLLVIGDGMGEFRGQHEIARALNLGPDLVCGYVAEPRRLYQRRDLVLLIGDGVINVALRGSDHTWRFAISVLDLPRLESTHGSSGPVNPAGKDK
jgi:hypothetical protein